MSGERAREQIVRSRTLAGIAFLLVAGFSLSARAQRGEVTANYSFVVYNPAKSFASHRDLSGGGGSFGFNLGDHLTMKAEFEAYSATTLTYTVKVPPAGVNPGTFNAKGDLFTYLFGPQFNAHTKNTRVFGEALFGGAYTNAYANFFYAAGVTGLSATNNGFAMVVGGGLDVPVSRRIAIRPLQFDYFLTRYEWKSLGINNQSNFRYQAGIVYAFGKYYN
jgi:hypothetical protein